MTPKKAIIIILFLFFIIAVIFAVLYVNNKQAVAPSDELNANRAGQSNGVEKIEPSKPADMIEEKINKIIEDSKQDPQASPETIRQEIISTINAEIIRLEENKTPDQKAADLKAREERQKIIDQINSQIK